MILIETLTGDLVGFKTKIIFGEILFFKYFNDEDEAGSEDIKISENQLIPTSTRGNGPDQYINMLPVRKHTSTSTKFNFYTRTFKIWFYHTLT